MNPSFNPPHENKNNDELNIINIFTDCDSDTLIFEVELEGIGACHTGKKSCFYKKLEL